MLADSHVPTDSKGGISALQASSVVFEMSFKFMLAFENTL